jgi:predicted CXXCH cytochrome family protein
MRYGWVLLVMAGANSGQEIDTAIVPALEQRRSTILDQIANRDERVAFEALYRAIKPEERRDRGRRFLQDFPQSVVLAQAYEIAAKAAIELGDYTQALAWGDKSLRILPENPLLLAPLADVEARQSRFDQAAASARDALWYLDRFDRPLAVSADAWPQVQRNLRAVCYFVLGRVSAARAAQSSGAQRGRHLQEARQALLESLSLDSKDDEAVMLLGMVHLSAGDREAAAACFAHVSRGGSALAQGAKERLRATGYAERATSLQWSPPEPSPPPAPQRKQWTYAGTEVCRECHAAQHANWQATGMARMFRPYRPEHAFGDFQSGASVQGRDGHPAARVAADGDARYIEIRSGNAWQRYQVSHIIGSKWQQAYATLLPGGRIQVFPIQYSRLEKRWLNYWRVLDGDDSARADIPRFHEYPATGAYQINCAPCHTSQLQGTTFAEAGVNCEMCHGPSGAHVAATKAGKAYSRPANEPPVDFPHISSADYVAICAQCHMQSGVREPESGGAINYSAGGERFYRVYLSRPYVDYSRRAFYKDGRFRETTFIVEAFLRSKCFRVGGATCGTCHDPHPPDAAANTRSLKFGADSDRVCAGCHARIVEQAERHTHHRASSDGSRCVSCHMPRIMNALLFRARSHQIDEIPDVAMTERFGEQESPNACLGCHAGQSIAWVRRKLASW